MKRAWFFVALVALSIAGCAGRASAPRSPSPPPEYSQTGAQTGAAGTDGYEAPTDLNGLLRDFERQAETLDEQLARRATTVEQPPAPGPAPTSPPTPEIDSERPDLNRPTGSQPLSKSHGLPRGSACDLACRALASMRRSADGICQLTSEQDERCQSAQSRVQRATDRVRRAGCHCL